MRIYVSTTAPAYTMSIYRIGWYQGTGGRLMYTFPILPGIAQPAPLFDRSTRTVSCDNWHDPVIISIPSYWVSGVYVVKLISSQGYMRYTSFVIRNDASTAPILLQTSVLTYQAYNLWEGYNLYRGYKGGSLYTYAGNDYTTAGNLTYESPALYTSMNRAYAVSFDRPLYDYNGDPGLGDFVNFEYDLVRWMEREGYNLTYSTDIDTDLRGTLLLNHHLFIVAGHDEYWSTAMRNAVTTARNVGVSLAFIGGNDMYWHVRLQATAFGPDREVICYKAGYYAGKVKDPLTAKDPKAATVRWRDPPLNQMENAVLGEMYGGAVELHAPLALSSGSLPFLRNTSLRIGSTLKGLVSDEYDHYFQNAATPKGVSILAASPVICIATVDGCTRGGHDVANATLYVAQSGARVFDAGTETWSWGLDDDHIIAGYANDHFSNEGFQQYMANILSDLLAKHVL